MNFEFFNQIFSVIYGLDPAKPLFDFNKPEERLNATDAQSTIALHTNTKLAGITEPITQVDFYPNGGEKQPGCGYDLSGSCSHGRAYELYAEAVGSNNLMGRKCASYEDAKNGNCSDGETLIFNGDVTEIDTEGIYYFKTNDKSPFALG